MEQETNQPIAHQFQLEIVHALPGRMRLRLVGEDSEEKVEVDSVTVKPSKLENLLNIAQHLQQQEGVESVQVKEISNSLVVNFDAQTLSTSQLKECLSPFNIPSISSGSKAYVTPENGAKLFSKLLSLIPILLGWLVVKRFNLSGWKAIVTYVLATGVIREVIEQVQSEIAPSLVADENPLSTKEEPKKILSLNQEQELNFKIVHHIPGRIRLSLPKIRKDLNYAQKLQSLFEQDETITAVRINTISGSVVVQYLQEAFNDVSEEELTFMLSNLLELLDEPVIALETSNTLITNQAENTMEIDGQFSGEK